MKNNVLKLIILFSVFILVNFSCKKSTSEIEHAHIAKMLDQLSINDDIQWVVLLPGLGCHGCIQEGEMFLEKHVNDKKIYLILTNIESLKILQNKLGIKVNISKNVYVDRDNDFLLPTKNKVYPCVIYLNNGKYISHEFQAPGNNAFDELDSQL